jgi:hypothetical protein
MSQRSQQEQENKLLHWIFTDPVLRIFPTRLPGAAGAALTVTHVPPSIAEDVYPDWQAMTRSVNVPAVLRVVEPENTVPEQVGAGAVVPEASV